MSKFLNFIRMRFEGKKGETDDYVPWELDDKLTAYKFVEYNGFPTAHYVAAKNIDEVIDIASSWKSKRFVIKQPNLHSAQNILLLERTNNKFIDLLTMKQLDLSEIKTKAREPSYWLVEECIQGEIYGKIIPFDYKIYCFYGKPTVIIQIDRNVYPPRVALFDGSFIPLKPNEHYFTDKRRWLYGHHVIPFCAPALLNMASNLSMLTNSPFVSVDCYCSQDGPKFGEFTFAPGAPDVKMLTFSDTVLQQLDRAIMKETINNISGICIDNELLLDSSIKKLTSFSDEILPIFKYISAYGAMGDKRYGNIIGSFKATNTMQQHFQFAARMIGLLNGDEEQSFYIWNFIRSKKGFINGDDAMDNFSNMALAFHDSKGLNEGGNPWHICRAAEIRLAKHEYEALNEIKKVAAQGYEYAQRLLSRYKNIDMF